jgi:hypothetical protein
MSANGQYQMVISNVCTLSVNYGQDWTVIDYPQSSGDAFLLLGDFRGVSYSATGDLMILLNNASEPASIVTQGVYLSRSSLKSVPTKTTAPDIEWQSVCMSASGQYILASTLTSTGIYQSTDFGQTWKSNGNYQNVVACSMSASGQYQVMVDGSGYIHTSVNYGHSWTDMLTGSPRTWRGIAISSSGQYITAVGAGEQVFICTNPLVDPQDIPSGSEKNPVKYGYQSGVSNQTIDATAIGVFAGYTDQSQAAVAVGFQAGFEAQGTNAIAIGYQAGLQNQAPNSIILNASTGPLENTTESGLFINPIRYNENDPANETAQLSVAIGYDDTTSEVLRGFLGQSALSKALQEALNLPVQGAATTTGFFNVAQMGYSDPFPQYVIGYQGPDDILGKGTLTFTQNVSSLMTLSTFVDFGLSLCNVGDDWSTVPIVGSWKDVATSSSGKYQTAITSPGGSIFVSSNYGSLWSNTGVITHDWVSVTVSSSGQYQLVCSSDGYVFSSNDFGGTWTEVWNPSTTASTYEFTSVTMSSSGQYQLITAKTTVGVQDGVTLTSSNYGGSFDIVFIFDATSGSDTPFIGSFTSVALASGSNYLLVASDGLTAAYSAGI